MSAPRILVIRRRYLGDIVLLGSVVRNLRLHWPAAHIAFLTEAAYAGVVPLNPEINAALTLPRSALEWPGFVAALRRARFTHVLDFDNTEKTAVVTRLTGAAVRATFNRELIVHRYPRFYTHTAKVTNAFYDSHHITETYLALPAALGVPIVSHEIRLCPTERDLEYVRELLGRTFNTLVPPGTKRVLVHPGSRSSFRIWPPERFGQMCDQIRSELKARVVLLAGPGEQELVNQIMMHARSEPVEISEPLSVPRFAALAAQFDAFLCHDSGPMHIAAGVGTPVVALFGSQNATIWRPVGERHTVLQTALPCACFPAGTLPGPCVRDDSYRSYCVRRITAADVFSALAEKLRG